MIKVRDFECNTCGERWEAFVEDYEHYQPCPECAGTGSVIISGTAIGWLKMGHDCDFPTASKKWEESKAKRKLYEKKYDRDLEKSGEL